MPSGSFVVYNGVVLPATEQLAFDRENIYDGPTYLYTRVLLHVRAVYNPSVTSYNFDQTRGQRLVIPLAMNGQYPALTDNVIRFRLSQPRGFLAYYVGGQLVLSSPGFQPDWQTLYPCDCKGGPFPIRNPIVEVLGPKSFLVDFAIETFVNEAIHEVPYVAPVILSHRWRRRQSIDEHFYSTVETTGHAVFRADILSVYQRNAGGAPSAVANFPVGNGRPVATMATPDDFRNWLFHSVPSGFRRVGATVVPSEDGMSIDYSIIDRQVDVKFPASIAKVEAWQRISTEAGQGLDMLKSLFKAGMDVVPEAKDEQGEELNNVTNNLNAAGLRNDGNLFQKAGHYLFYGLAAAGAGMKHIGNNINPIADNVAKKFPDAGSFIDAASNFNFGLQDLLHGNLVPLMHVTITAKVWGDPSATMDNMTNVAYGVVMDRFAAIGNIVENFIAARTSCQIQQSLSDRYVELAATKSMPLPAKILLPNGGVKLARLPDFRQFNPAIGSATSQLTLPNPGVEIPNPTGAAETANRAYYSGLIASQLFLTNVVGTGSPAGEMIAARALPPAGG